MADNANELTSIRTELQRLVSEAFGELPGQLPDDIPILDIGVNSLALVEGMRRVYERFGVLISIRRMIEDQVTLSGLALYIDQELHRQRSAKVRAQAAANDISQKLKIERSVPLPALLAHIAFLSRYSSEANAAFNEAVIVQLAGELHGPALQASIDEVLKRNEFLRTALDPEQDRLDVIEATTYELSVSPVSAASLQTQLTDIVSIPFESGKPLFRAELLRQNENDHFLVLVGHRLTLDGRILNQVLGQIAQLYSLYAQDENAGGLPGLSLELPNTEQVPDLQSQTYWETVFTHSASTPRIELPSDFPRPPVKKYGGARVTRNLGFLDQAAQQALSVASGLFLLRLTGENEIVLGIQSDPIQQQNKQALTPYHTSTLPLRLKYDPSSTFSDYLLYFRHNLAEGNRNRNFSLAGLIRTLQFPIDQSRSALFSVAFQMSAQTSPLEFSGLISKLILPPSSGAKYDLELIAFNTVDGTLLVCDYSTELFEASSIARWLTDIQTLLTSALEDGSQTCANLPIIDSTERSLLLEKFNDSARPVPQNQTVLSFILEQTALHPRKDALRFGEQVLTYAQLLQRTKELAGALQKAGVEPSQRVGVLLHRSLDLLPAMLSVWYVGGIIVPLDSTFPAQRLAFMLEDAGVQTVLTQHALLSKLNDEIPAQILCIDDDLPQNSLSVRLESWASALILFTSGSTGKPKGVEIRHSSLLNTLLYTREQLKVGPESHMLALTTTSFDISTNELYMPLMCGALVEVSEDGLVADGLQLAERLNTQPPSHVQATPSTWKSVLAAGWQGSPDICLLTAGENLGRDLAEELLMKSKCLWNLYGPTETTVYSVVCQVSSAPGQPVRIGRPLANTHLYVLDSQRQLQPVGAVGELYIGGAGVAPGYWNRAELSAERFLPDPFLGGDAKMYRTGDLVRYLPQSGDLLCLGRVDEQVKIHGVRVELGEVEAALRKLKGVSDAVVTSWKDAQNDTQLVAHIIPAENQEPSVQQIRTWLRETLPEVMVPPNIVFTQSFPMTANGKIQRAALSSPTQGQIVPAANSEPPLTATEHALAKVWAQVLMIDPALIGRSSDFIDLGGHSLLMTRLMLELRKQFQVTFKLREFFEASTLRKTAELIDRLQKNSLGDLQERAHDQRPLPAHDAEWARQRMAFLTREAELPQYISPARGLRFQAGQPINSVFLTGATGFLGAYIVAEILRTTNADLYCLVRPKRGEPSGKQRIEIQMRSYAVWGQDEAWQQAWNTRLHVVDGDVTLPRMGLPDAVYEDLARKVDAIFHGAAHVNFIYPYEALRATNVLGVHEIIQFAFHTRIKQVHHLSTAAIWPMGAQYTFREKDPIDHKKLLNLGYDEAKWVGEKCLLHAAERGLPVARYRPGEVGGDSLTGHCVTDHFLIASFKGFLQFGAFPELDMEVDVAPVDYVAKAMVYLAFNRQPLGRAFHLTNPSRRKMKDALGFLRELGYQFTEMPFEELRDKLVKSEGFASNALFAYQAALEEMNNVSMELPTYDTRETRRELEGSGIQCAPADEKLFSTYLQYLLNCGFMPAPNTLHNRESAHA